MFWIIVTAGLIIVGFAAVLGALAIYGGSRLSRHEREDEQPMPSERGVW